jgi:hypothetical protein
MPFVRPGPAPGRLDHDHANRSTSLLADGRGPANLGYGVVRGLGGLFAAPFDGGRELRAGWSGAFFSLPELLFCNVRKGTFRDVEPDEEHP